MGKKPHFEKIREVPDHIIPELSEMVDVAFKTMYDFTYNEEGEIEYGVNLSGHTVYKTTCTVIQ